MAKIIERWQKMRAEALKLGQGDWSKKDTEAFREETARIASAYRAGDKAADLVVRINLRHEKIVSGQGPDSYTYDFNKTERALFDKVANDTAAFAKAKKWLGYTPEAS